MIKFMIQWVYPDCRALKADRLFHLYTTSKKLYWEIPLYSMCHAILLIAYESYEHHSVQC